MAVSVALWLGLAVSACGADRVPEAAPDSEAVPDSEAARAEATAPAPPPAADDSGRRVVFLGTSLTAGLGLRRPEDRWPETLGRMADSAGLAIHIVNAGRSGDTSTGGLNRLDWILQSGIDVLVIELGANDGLRGQPPAVLEDNLRTIIRRARKANPAVEILLVGMEAPTNLGNEYTTRFRKVFSTVADDLDVALVPFLLEGVAGVPALNQADQIHPTAEGHALIARTVWPYLEPLLRATHEEVA